MQPQSTAQQTREIAAHALKPGMTVIDGTDGPLVVTVVSRYAADTVLVYFTDVPEPTRYAPDAAVSVVEDSKPVWFFTFGSGQQNDGKYVVIPGTYDEARDVMLAHFGNAWSFQYGSAERAGVEEFGVVELPRSEWPQPAAAEDPDEDDAIAEEIDQAFAEKAADPDLRQRLAAELHRIADDIVTQKLPLGRLMSATLSPGVLDSRADLDRWTTYLGSPVRIDSNGIPFTEAQIRLGKKYGASLTVGAQTRQEHPSELEQLRARVAELEAERTAGGAR